MCNGTIMDKLISFSLPLMLSGILQLMFNAVDIIVVGRFSGSQALAAVGSTTALINVFTNLFIGISLGANVLAARFYAAGKETEMKKWYSENCNVEVNVYPNTNSYCVVNNTYEVQDTRIYTDHDVFDIRLQANEIRWFSISGEE